MTAASVLFPYLPERIEGLAELAMNLSWSWNRTARALFMRVDEPLWHLTRHNPIAVLRRVNPGWLSQVARDPDFLALYDKVMADYRADRGSDQTWFVQQYPDCAGKPVAYFCAEFGLHNSVPIYSGGLGVLAGDHCKASSDLGVPLLGVGLFYTKGYFDQQLRIDGWQEDSDERFDPANAPLERLYGPGREPFLATVRTFGRDIHVGAWRMQVGRVPVYLLDTDIEQNHPDDRPLASKLYAGGPDLRLRQEWILGVGGVRVLRTLGIDPSAWHANEGHAAFMMIERVRELVRSGVSFDDAVARMRAAGIFTTHTPVPAGHDHFPAEQFVQCAGPIWEEMGVDRDRVLALGANPVEGPADFHMTALAIRLSGRVNGVAKKHGEVSRRIWQPLWHELGPEDVPIGHVTNGVHLATWMSHHMMSLFDECLGPEWGNRIDDPALWDQVLRLPADRLWRVHGEMKGALMHIIREEARRRWARHWKVATHIVGAGTLLNPNALTIGFARRFATYKRANLVFRDPDRLRAILVNPWRPVQIVFAGKAHPADTPGKEVLKQVYSLTRDATLEGRVAFIEDYDMHLAHRLVQGVDLWLNLPRVPMEASGTSGMKAALNGVPQLSTLDGWWPEAYDGENGWAMPAVVGRSDADASDATGLYDLLEKQVVPLFYERDANGLPQGWIGRMRHAIRAAGAKFTARRMLQQYASDYYVPAIRGEPSGTPAPTD
jgi:starch phosphorylase